MNFTLDDNGAPVFQPLTNIKELLQWFPKEFYVHKLSSSECQRKAIDIPDQFDRTANKRGSASHSKLLVCHDMHGGYVEDRFYQGCSQATSYRFYHWQLIDIFIYFSHHFVTIPPLGWIKAAHKHGVTILGTIITEWDDGAVICKEMLESAETIDKVTTKLAQIALDCGFDGWLINVENKIEIEQIPQLQSFVQQLTAKCHSHLQSSKVIWYDSVISTGELKWQDELNSNNEMFFHVSDGIFLNYCITEEKLAKSKALASQMEREFDVYVGIDVFGRGTAQGGGFNSRETLKMIMDHGLSCALFAPGWVHEVLGKENFDSNEEMFWGIISELRTPVPVNVPFATSFCQGYGDKLYMMGQVLSDTPWYNISLQQTQLSFTQSQFVTYNITKTVGQLNSDQEPKDGEKKEKLRIDVESHESHPAQPKITFEIHDGYIGGGCLKLSAKVLHSSPVQFRLFQIRSDKNTSLKISMTWKIPANSSFCFGLFVVAHDQCGRVPGKRVICTQQELRNSEKNMLENFFQDGSQQSGSDSTLVYVVDQEKDNSSNISDENWRTSIFVVSLTHSSEEPFHNEEMTLSVILMPLSEKKFCTEEHMHMLIGHLQVVGHSDVLPVQNEPLISSMKCLEVKVRIPLNPEDKKQILQTVCSAMGSQPDSKSDNLSGLQPLTETTKAVSQEQMCDGNVKNNCCLSRFLLDLPVSQVLSSNNPSTLYILKWLSPGANIDYYLIYRYDHMSIKHFIGQAPANYFVWRQNDEVCFFSVQPVSSFTCQTLTEILITV